MESGANNHATVIVFLTFVPMKRKPLYQAILPILMLSFMGCWTKERRSMTIEIQNNTGAEIAKAQVWAIGSSASKLLIDQTNLAVSSTHRQAVKYNLGLASDGGYELRLMEAAGNRTFTFGYFTNGTSLDKSISFQVEKDTIVAKSVIRY